MPELNDVIKKPKAGQKAPVKTKSGPIEATVIDEQKAPVPASTPTPVTTTAPVTEEKKPKAGAKKPAKTETEVETVEPKYVRPPIEQIVRDIDTYIETLSINKQPIKKLGYKCGKIIFGLPANGTGKDFRVIAYKARKRTKSVSGKSRVIFYFGIHEDTKQHVKEILGASSSKFGRCSVQISDPIEPIELKLDKVIFSEIFGKDVTKVMDTLKKLCILAIESKTAIYNAKAKKELAESVE